MADKKKDPTITSDRSGDAPEGSHPALPVEEAADSAVNKKYRAMPGLPDPSTVAQVEVTEK